MAWVTRVCSLAAPSPDAIQVLAQNRSIPVGYGEEVVLGESDVNKWLMEDTIDRRKVRIADVDQNLSVAKSEASPFSIFNASDLLCEVYDSKDRLDKIITEKIVKMATCLTLVTSKNGPYARLK